MSPPIPPEEHAGWRSPPVWAEAFSVDDNPIKQLLVPGSVFRTVSETDGGPVIENRFGRWPVFQIGSGAPTGTLAAQVPLGIGPGTALRRASWVGPQTRWYPQEVLDTYPSALNYETGIADDTGALRIPQRGALHAVLGYWTTERGEPATIVMPTGTGKTETMLALLVAGRPKLLLVVVPSDALREQTAAKFERLGILQEQRIVTSAAMRPVVGRLLHGLKSTDAAVALADACNVMVATAAVLAKCTDDARSALLERCSHLFIDEAHHVAAQSWTAIREAFDVRPVVQFTATPFREDGRRVSGRQIYAFPLRLAQEQGYFSPINYTSVIDFENLDETVARQALDQLRRDLVAGHDHILMARVESIPRLREIVPIYERLAPDLQPLMLHGQLGVRAQRAARTAIVNRTSRIVVCVNMLGEGFDLPALKVAAVHDPRKSLAVTLQFIGRFARTSSDDSLGEASAFVARREIATDKRLRLLYAEDSDWNTVIRDLSESAVQAQQDISDFDTGFTSRPEEVDVRNLLPKMSTVVYRTPSESWNPLSIVDHFGEENLLTVPIGLNEEAGVAWCVVVHRDEVRWGDIKTVEEVIYELFILYFDKARQLLYINSSENSGVFQEIADLVVGQGATRYTGSTIYRVMGDITRLTPTNVGVLDIHSQFRRFSMHVGSDVSEGFSVAEAQNKTQTNISGNGFRDGERVNISASIKGRIWSHAAANSLKQWCDWCDVIGTKLLDDSISIDDVIGNFLLPREIDARPHAVLLGAEWPWDVYIVGPERYNLQHNGVAYNLVDVALVPADDARTGPLRITLDAEGWSVTYRADYSGGRLTFGCEDPFEVHIATSRGAPSPLSTWLTANGLTFLLEGDQLIDQNGLLLRYDHERPPYPRDRLQVLDWTGVDIHVESQGPTRRPDSIQAYAVTALLGEGDWDIVIDDDGKGEVADLVGLQLDDDGLLIKLVHCKYAHGAAPGSRLDDLYEVCGQASKSVSWRRSDMVPFFGYLDRRARQKQQRTGVSPFLVGNERAFYRLQDEAQVRKRRLEVVIAQPGLSAGAVSDAQLEVLASTESYLRNTVNAPLTIWCNA
jgi:superfamily II DNA or RNA helicase